MNDAVFEGDDDAIDVSGVKALRRQNLCVRARTIDDAFNDRPATLLLDVTNHTRVHCFN